MWVDIPLHSFDECSSYGDEPVGREDDPGNAALRHLPQAPGQSTLTLVYDDLNLYIHRMAGADAYLEERTVLQDVNISPKYNPFCVLVATFERYSLDQCSLLVLYQCRPLCEAGQRSSVILLEEPPGEAVECVVERQALLADSFASE